MVAAGAGAAGEMVAAAYVNGNIKYSRMIRRNKLHFKQLCGTYVLAKQWCKGRSYMPIEIRCSNTTFKYLARTLLE